MPYYNVGKIYICVEFTVNNNTSAFTNDLDNTTVQPQRKVRNQMLKQENEIRVLIYAYPHENIKGVDVPRRYVTAATRAFRAHDVCEVISTWTYMHKWNVGETAIMRNVRSGECNFKCEQLTY